MTEQPTAKSTRIRRLIMVLAGIFIFFILLLAGAAAVIQSEWGKRKITEFASSAASSDNFIVRLEGLSGVIPFDIRLEKFSLADARGVWLAGENLAVEFSVADLLTKTFRFPKIYLHQIILSRTPQGGEEIPEESDERGITSPDQIQLPHVVVNELLVDRVVLAPPLTGSVKVFKVKGTQTLFGSKASLDLDIISQEGPDEFLNLEFDIALTSPSPVVSVQAHMEEAPGGILGELMDLPKSPAISARLQGQGPLTGWSGQLSVRAEETLSLDTSFKVGYDLDLAAELTGTIAAAPGFLPEEAEAWAGREARYEIKAKWGRDRILALEDVKVATPKADLKLKGDLNLETMTTNSFLVLKPLDWSHLESLSGVILEPGRLIEGQISGPILQPLVNLKSDIGKVVVADMSIDNLVLDIQASTTLPFDKGMGDIKSQGQLILTGLDVPPRRSLPEKTTFKYDLAIEDLARLNISHFDLDGGWMKISGDYSLTFDELVMASRAHIEVDDLKKLAELGSPLSGRVSMDAEVKGQLPDRVETDINSRFSGLGGLPEQAFMLMGRDPKFTGRVVWDKDKVLFHQVQVKGGSTLTADGSYDVTRDNFDLKYDASIFGLAGLLKEYKVAVSEPAIIKGNLTGPGANPAARAEAVLAQLTAADQKFSDIKIQAEARDLAGDINGRVEIRTSTRGQPLSTQTQFILSGSVLAIKQFQAGLNGAEVSLDASLDLGTGLAKGKAYLGSRDLSGPGRLFGLNLGGGAAIHLKLDDNAGRQGLEIDGKANSLRFEGARIAELTIKANSRDIKSITDSQAQIRLSNMAFGEAEVKSAAVDLSGKADFTKISAKASGSAGKPFTLKAEADIRENKDVPATLIQLRTLELKYDRLPVKLAKPASLEFNQDGWKLAPLDLHLASGKITAQGNMTRESVSLTASTRDLPLKTLSSLGPVGLNGNLSSQISISGPPANPSLNGDLKLAKIGLTEPGAEGVPLANLDLSFKLTGRTLKAGMNMTGLGPKPGRAEASLPLEFSMKPFKFHIPDSGRLSGKLNADLDLSTIPAIFNLDLQTMSGQAKVDLTLAGSVASPSASGRIGLNNGQYENVRLGVVLHDIDADITGEGPDIRVTRFTATDGESGRFTADGSIILDPDKKFPYQLKLEVDQAELVRLDLVSSRGTGNINLSGTVTEAKVTGQLTLDPTNVNIPRKLPGQVTELQVTQINAPPSEEKDKKKSAPADEGVFNADMDVTVTFPGRFFVRGEGLTSEWKGDIKVVGSSSKPVITGKLDLVRGSYDFLSRRFILTQGALTFDGSYPPLPYVDLTGEVTASDITAKINITGSVTSPNLALESEPVLPQDEILARVLFGKDLSQISPVQALSLAKAAVELSGGGSSGPGLMDKTRKMLHLDQLQFKTGQNGDTAIGAGKYLGDRVYVEAQGGMTPEDQKVTVQIELLPRVNLETEVGADSTGSVGINWKLDY